MLDGGKKNLNIIHVCFSFHLYFQIYARLTAVSGVPQSAQ